MKKTKIIIYIFIILIVLLCVIFTTNRYKSINEEIDKSISIEHIQDEKIIQGLLNEKQRIKDDERRKVIIGESVLLISSIVAVVVVNKKIN